MPSLPGAFSMALGSFNTGRPESVSFTSPVTSDQYLGDFSGHVSRLDLGAVGSISGLVPLTVFSGYDGLVTCDWLQRQVAEYQTTDDVFDQSFLQTIYVPGTVATDVPTCMKEAYGTEAVYSGRDEAVEGPYIAAIEDCTATLAPVYRVMHDEYQSFMSGLLPSGGNGSFRYANTNTVSDSTVGIPLPSRLYASKAANKTASLQGLRVTIKDIIDLKGVKTSNGNRAWFKLYDAVNSTAPAIQRVIDLGAKIIGKTKTAQFAQADRVTADWVDYHDAFNPRGDGYQDPGVSSAGAGSSAAAYDWVDVSIGTDTGGSVRIPASKNGLFGLRPSFGATSNEGVMPEGEFFDAVGYMTRSPEMLRTFGKAWLAQSNLTTGYRSFPKKLIVPSNLWPVEKNDSQAIFSDWIDKLATHLDATIVTTGIGEYWNETANKPGTEFFDYMQTVGFDLNWKHQWEVLIQPFLRDYAAAFGNRTAFINPYPTARFESAANVTDADVAESYKRFIFFRDWFGQEVVKAASETCSESLFLIPMFSGEVVSQTRLYRSW